MIESIVEFYRWYMAGLTWGRVASFDLACVFFAAYLAAQFEEAGPRRWE